MGDLEFLPPLVGAGPEGPWSALANPVLLAALLLLAGIVGGEIAQRVLWLPRITGYTLAGVLLGPAALGALAAPLGPDWRIFIDISLGLILFELGQRVDLRWFMRSPGLAAMAIAESALGSLAVYFTLTAWFGFSELIGAAAAAVTMSTSPVVVMRVAADTRAQGQVTERALTLAAVNTVLAVCALAVVAWWAAAEFGGRRLEPLAQTVYLLGGSFALAAVMARVTLALVRLVGKAIERQFLAVVAMVMLTVGVAIALKLSVVASLLACGALVRIYDARGAVLAVDFGRAGILFYLVLFVLIGASLDLAVLREAWLPALVLVAVRFAGKAAGLFVFARWSRLPLKSAALLAVALLPMSGLAVVLVHDASALAPGLGRSVAPVVLAAVVMLELIGPIATQAALRLAGEAEPAGGAVTRAA